MTRKALGLVSALALASAVGAFYVMARPVWLRPAVALAIELE